MVGTLAVWLCTVKPGARPAAVARFGDLDAGLLESLVRLGDVGRAPRQAPELVGPIGHAFLQIVRDLDHQIAAAEEQQPRAPVRIAAVEPEVEPQPSGIEGDRALGVGRAHHDVIERGDRRRLAAPAAARARALRALAEHDRHAVCRRRRQHEAVALAFARHRAPLEQPRRLVERRPWRTPSTKAASWRRLDRSPTLPTRSRPSTARRPSNVSYAPADPASVR